MVTAWVIKKKNRFGKIQVSIEFYGDKMTQEDLERHYSGNPEAELISVKQVDPDLAWKIREKYL